MPVKITKVNAEQADTGVMGQQYLAQRENVAMRLWHEDMSTDDKPVRKRDYVTVGDNSGGLGWNSSARLSSGDAMRYPGASLLVFNDEGKTSEFYGYYDTRQFSSTRSAEEE